MQACTTPKWYLDIIGDVMKWCKELSDLEMFCRRHVVIVMNVATFSALPLKECYVCHIQKLTLVVISTIVMGNTVGF